MDGAGAVIWEGLIAGFSRLEIEARLAAAFDAVPAVMHAAFSSLLAELTSKNLIQPGTARHNPGIWSSPAPAQKLPFTPPTLNTYGDLQDLAQLDPIHDVEAQTGWPNRRTEIQRD